MKMKNYGSLTLKSVDLLGPGVTVKPGEVVDLPEGYCHPRRSRGRARIASVCENLCPGLEPADAAVRAEWRKTPEINWMPPSTAPSAKTFEADGIAPGVAAILAQREKAKLEAVQHDPPPAPEAVPVDPPPPSTGPTLEEFMDAGYKPEQYPPRGYDEVPSEALTAYRAEKAKPVKADEPKADSKPEPKAKAKGKK